MRYEGGELWYGAQTKRPKTKRPKGPNVPSQNFPRHKVPGTKRPKGQNVLRQNIPRDKTSQGTKRPKDKMSQGTKCPTLISKKNCVRKLATYSMLGNEPQPCTKFMIGVFLLWGG